MHRLTFIAVLIAAFAIPHVNAKEIRVTMDQVRLYNVDEAVEKIVIGNPAIVDARTDTVDSLLLFGKSPGLTNIRLFDKEGKPAGNLLVRVHTQASDMLSVYRGSKRTTYSCADICEVAPEIGDDSETFSAAISQASSKFDQARQAGRQ